MPRFDIPKFMVSRYEKNGLVQLSQPIDGLFGVMAISGLDDQVDIFQYVPWNERMIDEFFFVVQIAYQKYFHDMSVFVGALLFAVLPEIRIRDAIAFFNGSFDG